MKIKKFNEMLDNIQVSTTEYGSIRTMRFLIIDLDVINTFKLKIKEGFTPYYFDLEEYKLKEVPVDKKSTPLKIIKLTNLGHSKKEQTIRKFNFMEKNEYGEIYFLKDSELTQMENLLKKIKSTLILMDEQRENMIDLIGSYVTHKLK